MDAGLEHDIPCLASGEDGQAVAPKVEQRRIGILLLPGYSLLGLGAMTEAFEAANAACGERAFVCRRIALGVSLPAGTGGRRLDLHSEAEVAGTPSNYDAILLPGGEDRRDSYGVCAWLRRGARHGVLVGGFGDACRILGRAGLLHERPCAVHWSLSESFSEDFPEADLRPTLYELHRGVLTCAGGAATLDAVIELIAHFQDRRLATEVAERLVYQRLPEQPDSQRLSMARRLGTANPHLASALEMIESELDEPISSGELAARVGISPRQLERLFSRYVGCSPLRYHRERRLEKARTLLTQTSLPVTEVAVACGFTSVSHFTRCYKRVFGEIPSKAR
ncbi:GlxA family transcriptional regulator [Ferruginivarius sediminum]|uniref:Helix-turn-helix domain-containing protein n=1 Tax=Ferruginivarius sediminum TaxID=2661937 RepID=A0A369T805_9PROT|nr:helix-turn-helix domain-containing protein [Ferruginivarius sediminum]RDD61022.1 helix-turn-helix domain-containing protein [Ferruginivarius sediminum]